MKIKNYTKGEIDRLFTFQQLINDSLFALIKTGQMVHECNAAELTKLRTAVDNMATDLWDMNHPDETPTGLGLDASGSDNRFKI